MFVLFVVLNETDYLDAILAKFVELGVRGATILDSQGMAGALSHHHLDELPLFGSLRNFLDGAKPSNKTIFTVVKDQELVDKVVESVQSLLSNCKRPGAGFMFTVPVGNIYLLKNSKK